MTVRIRSGAPTTIPSRVKLATQTMVRAENCRGVHITGCKSTADDLAWNEEAVGAAPTILTNILRTLSRGFA